MGNTVRVRVPPFAPITSPSSYRPALRVVLGVSLLLRVVLVLSGGERFWPDELRYDRSREAVAVLGRGDGHAVVRALAQPDHLLFGVLGLLPATVEVLAGPDDRVPALFFSLFSVLNIALVDILARRLGETERTGFLAALLFASSTTQLYYARHLLPYDAAISFALLGLIVGMRSKTSLKDAALCGLLSAAALLTYNGYFLLSGSALVFCAFTAASGRIAVRRLAVSVAAFAAPFAVLLVADALSGGALLREWLRYSATVTQGSFAEGGWLPFAYLWHAEHLLTAVWAAGFAFAAVRLASGDRRPALVVGAAGILLIYFGLVAGSNVFQKFVVYGRQARQLVPFACVLSAAMLDRLLAGGIALRRFGAAAVAAVLAQAAWNFRAPILQVFPEEFRRMAQSIPNPTGAPRFVLYAEFIYPKPVPVPAGIGRVLLARNHPLQFLPYQYEGYTPEERAALRAIDIRMRLVEVP